MESGIFLNVFEDGLFAAIAAIGFSSISNTPRRAYLTCGIFAAVGHAVRFILMSCLDMQIILASTIAAFCVGLIAVLAAPRIKCPAEVCFFPALLPMIPGMYAYRTVESIVMCLANQQESVFNHWLYMLTYNGLTCSLIITGMVIGATAPIFIFKHISFQATS